MYHVPVHRLLSSLVILYHVITQLQRAPCHLSAAYQESRWLSCDYLHSSIAGLDNLSSDTIILKIDSIMCEHKNTLANENYSFLVINMSTLFPAINIHQW